MQNYFSRRLVLKMVIGNTLEVQSRDSIGLQFVLNERDPVKFAIHDAFHVPKLAYHLLSLHAATKDGHSYNGVDDSVELFLKQGWHFRIHECGTLYCCKAQRLPSVCANVVIVSEVRISPIDRGVNINVFQASYGHANEALARKTAKKLNITLLGELES